LTYGLSMLTPSTWVSAASSLARFCWKLRTSCVQVGEKAQR
jgi:hypothetical protein